MDTVESSTENAERRGHSSWYVAIVAIFITTLIGANVTAVKIIDIFGLLLPAGTIIFPISYIFGDVLTEVYGYRAARRTIWLAFGCNLLFVAAVYGAQILPAAEFWDDQSAYERILGFTGRLLVASFFAYLMGEFINAYVLARLKVITSGRWLWLRTISSTLVGQGIDSAVFVTIAFIGTMPITILIGTAVTQWLAKSLYEALATPLTYVVVGSLKRIENIDVYDHDTSFSPFSMK